MPIRLNHVAVAINICTFVVLTGTVLLWRVEGAQKNNGEMSIAVARGPLTYREAINARLYLTAVADTDRSGRIAGWQLGVFRSGRPNSRNLLYESALWHGPHPSQFDAWSTAAGYWPAGPRRLPVAGHNILITAECLGCRTNDTSSNGTSSNSVFVAGELNVKWAAE
jgi:hypothetical protein